MIHTNFTQYAKEFFLDFDFKKKETKLYKNTVIREID